MSILNDFYEANREQEYAEFIAKLSPTYQVENIIGIRVPKLRSFAKDFAKSVEFESFMNTLPHKYYEDNLLHSILLCNFKDYDKTIENLSKFIPYMDGWAITDTCRPKCFRKNRDKLIKEIYKWLKSNKTYTIRFGLTTLMDEYFDEDFKEEYLEVCSKLRSKEYYVNMANAWLFATALAKQYDSTIKYIENRSLDKWTHNKTIQKAIESFRVSDEHKEYLKTLRYKE